MDEEFPPSAGFSEGDRDAAAAKPITTQRFPPASEEDELQAELARARRDAASGQLSEASEIASRLIDQLERPVPDREEALFKPRRSGPAHNDKARLAGSV